MKNKIFLFFASISISIRKKLIQFATYFVPQRYLLIEKLQQFWISYLLRVVIDLEISEKLNKETKNIEQLANETQTQADALYRVLRALSGEGFYKESGNKNFANTKLSQHLMRDHPYSLKYLIAHQLNKENIDMFMLLNYSLKTGIPASSKVFGMDPFEYMSKVPENNKLYNNAMEDSTNMLCEILILHYPFQKFKIIADIGGGNGSMLLRLIKKGSETTGIVFDLPHVIEDVHKDIITKGLKNEIQFQSGDFFKSIPINADLYILKNILHAFGDSDCIKILKNIKKTALSGSKIIVLEMDLGRSNQKAYGKLYDIQMLITVKNGRERTKNEYKKLFEESGLMFKREIKTISPFSIFESIVI